MFRLYVSPPGPTARLLDNLLREYVRSATRRWKHVIVMTVLRVQWRRRMPRQERAAMSDSTAVVVVGAGPVGLALGCELARRAVPVRILDKLSAPTAESRAAVVHARTLEAFSRTGVVEEIIAAGQRTTGLQMYADRVSLGKFALDTVDSPYPFSVTLPQDETERILTTRLSALGVPVERERELASFEQDASGVRAHLKSGEEIRSDWIVGTDGSHSTVRGALGLSLEGSFKGETFLLGDVEADHHLDRSTMHTFFTADAGPLMVFPMLGRRLRLIGQLDAPAPPTLEELQAIVDHRTSGFRLESERWITLFEIHHAQVRSYRVGRGFLAGDAAHVHSPAGGQGMNTGIQDAFNLGWKLAQAVTEGPSSVLLDSYHAERHPVAAQVIKVTTATTSSARGRRADVAAVNLHSTLARTAGQTALYIARRGQAPTHRP